MTTTIAGTVICAMGWDLVKTPDSVLCGFLVISIGVAVIELANPMANWLAGGLWAGAIRALAASLVAYPCSCLDPLRGLSRLITGSPPP
jgi:hypothetical protein